MCTVLVQRGGQGRRFAQLLLITPILNLMHKSGDSAFRRAPGRYTRLRKGTTRKLVTLLTNWSGEFSSQAARVAGHGIDQMSGCFSRGRDRAWRMNDH